MVMDRRCRIRWATVALWAALVAVVGEGARPALAGDTLERVRSTGVVRCGVHNGLVGFAAPSEEGRWSGMEVDFCRAVAAAVLGNADKTVLVPTLASARFPLLKSRQVDVLLRRTTWTLGREAAFEVHFAGILFYDGQSFLVPREGPVRAVEDLDGATICLVKGTTHERHLADHFRARGMAYRLAMADSHSAAVEAYRRGECTALTGDASALALVASTSGPGIAGDRVLPGFIAKEPLGPVVNRGDEEWLTIVRWVLFALIEAEERGVTRERARELRAATRDPGLAAFLGEPPGPGKSLGLADDWVLRVVESVGNYGEIFARHLGAESPAHLERGLNRLWRDGGLLYAPPFR